MHTNHRRTYAPTLRTALAAALLAVTPTCTTEDADDGADDGAEPAPTTGAPTTVDPEEQIKSEVEDAYERYLDMTVRLASDPDPDDPEIDQRSVGETRDALVQALTSLREQNRSVSFGERNSSEVLSVDVMDGDTAVVEDCAVDDAATIDDMSGDIVTEGLATGLFYITLQLGGGGWRVAETPGPEQSWEGVAGCALD